MRQFFKIMIPLRQESNGKAENNPGNEFPQAGDEIASYSRQGLCGAIEELITIVKKLADHGVQIQLVGSAPSSTLLHVAGLSGICPEKNQFFERFLDLNSSNRRQEDFVLAGYSMFGPDRILDVLEQLGFRICETEIGLTASKANRMDGNNQLILLIRAKGLASNTIPTIEELSDDIAKNNISANPTDLQTKFVDVADRNGKSKQDALKLMRTIGPHVLPCKSHY